MSYVLMGLLVVVVVCLFVAAWKLKQIFDAFDNIILKRLTDTTMIEKHKLFVEALTKFSENDRLRKDKEFSEMRSMIKNLETDLRNARDLVDKLRKEV